MYFMADCIYSYGPHFLLGKFVMNKHGKTAIVLNDNHYSVATRQHQSIVRQIAEDRIDRPVFVVPFKHDGQWHNTTAELKEAREMLLQRAWCYMQTAKRARVHKDMHVEMARRNVQKANEMSQFFGLGYRNVTLETLKATCRGREFSNTERDHSVLVHYDGASWIQQSRKSVIRLQIRSRG